MPHSELDHVVKVLDAYRYSYQDEAQLQLGLLLALRAADLPVLREYSLSRQDRIDLLTGRVGIEVKIKGPADVALRQLQRYATSPLLDALVLVTSRAEHRGLPDSVGSKPLAVLYVGGVA